MFLSLNALEQYMLPNLSVGRIPTATELASHLHVQFLEREPARKSAAVEFVVVVDSVEAVEAIIMAESVPVQPQTCRCSWGRSENTCLTRPFQYHCGSD